MNRPRTTAASISQAESESYPAELSARRDSLVREYRRVLELMQSDLANDDSASFALHLPTERLYFRRLAACLRSLSALNIERSAQSEELQGLIELQQQVASGIAAARRSLQERLKKDNLRPRSRRLFDNEAVFVDFSC